MRLFLRLLVVASLAVLLAGASSAVSKTSYSKGCNTKTCEARVCKSSCQARLAHKAVKARAASASSNSLAQCIIHYESGGNTQAVNGSHMGIAQWTREAWQRHGGLRFSSTPLGATYEEQ